MNNLEKSKWLDEFVKSLDGKSVDELKTLEKEIVAECDAVDKEVAATEYKLPTKNYAEVAKGIRMLLDKQSVQWAYTLGLISMYDFWNPETNPKKVAYPMLDSTLRTLGNGTTFTGYSEWAAVVAVNKYFEPLREQYMKTTEKVYDAAAKHNAILDKLKLFENLEDAKEIAEIDEGVKVETK